MKLHSYWRSSSAYRVRIALNLKGLDYQSHYVHLARGEQRAERFRQLNPQAMVPVLEIDGLALGQSLAILEYLEERHPDPPLLPADAAGRARVRMLALAVACEMQPLNNLRVLQYLRDRLGQSEQAAQDWYRHWIVEGFTALERMLASAQTGRYCHGDAPTLADVCLVPQYYNAVRYGCDLQPYPVIRRIHSECQALPAFQRAAPELQPDAAP